MIYNFLKDYNCSGKEDTFTVGMRNILIVISLLFFSIESKCQTLPYNMQDINDTILNQHLINLINELRVKNGIHKLELNWQIYKAAKDHADWMSAHAEMTHYEKDPTTKTAKNRVEKYGGNYTPIGENIHGMMIHSKIKLSNELGESNIRTYERLAKSIFESWSSIKFDRQNMVDAEFYGACLGSAMNSDKGAIFIEQLFVSAPYLYPQQVKFIPKFNPADPEQCKRCESEVVLGEKRGSGIKIAHDSIYFYSDSKKLFFETIKEAEDGIAIDVVLRDQYPCLKPHSKNSNQGQNGFLLKPLYKKDCKDQNLDKGKGVKLFMGMIPGWIKQPYELNLTIINNNQTCGKVEYHHVNGLPWILIKPSPFLDTISPNRFSVRRDTTKIQLSKTSSSLTPGEINALKKLSSLGYVKSIQLTVEYGINHKIDQTRKDIQTKYNQLKSIYPELHIKLAQSFDFKNFNIHLREIGISETYSDSVKAIEVMLAHREHFAKFESIDGFQEIKITEEQFTPIRYGASAVIDMYKAALTFEHNNSVRQAQTLLFEHIQKGLLKYETLSEIEFIPKEKLKNAYINHLMLLREAANWPNGIRDIFSELRSLYEENDKHILIANNYAILLMDQYHSDLKHPKHEYDKNPIELLTAIPKLNKILHAKLEISAEMYNTYYYFLKQDYYLFTQSLNSLYKKATKARLTDEESYLLSKVFAYYEKFDYAFNIAKKLILSNTCTQEQVLYFAKLVYFSKNELSKSEIEYFLRNVAEISGNKFCKYFNSPNLNFQCLDISAFEQVYCEFCNQ